MKKLNCFLTSVIMTFAVVAIVSCSNDEEITQNKVANTSWQWEDPTHASFLPGSLSREERNLVLYSNGYAQMRDETCVWMGTDTLMHLMDYHHYTYTFDDATQKGVLSLYAMETYQGDMHHIAYMTKDYNFLYDPTNNKLTVQDSTVQSDGHKELVERVFDNVSFKQSEQPQLPVTPALTFVAPVTDWTVGVAEVRKYMAENLPEFKEEVDETIGHYYFRNKKETISYEYIVKDGKLVSSSVSYYGMNNQFDYFKSQVSTVFDLWSWKEQPVQQGVHWWSDTSKSAGLNASIGWSDNYGGYMYADFTPLAN